MHATLRQKAEPELFGGGAAVRGGRVQQEVEEDLVEELGILLLRQVACVRDHLHRRLLPKLLFHLVRFLDREDLVELAPDDQDLLGQWSQREAFPGGDSLDERYLVLPLVREVLLQMQHPSKQLLDLIALLSVSEETT